MRQSIAYLFYRDSDLVNGHGHRYIDKETNETAIDPLCRWPGGPNRHFHCFYFQRNTTTNEKAAWFVDGSWSELDVNNGFARYRDDLRKGWHIVKEGTRFIPIQGLFFNEDRAFSGFGNEEAATKYALYQTTIDQVITPRCQAFTIEGWGVLDLYGFRTNASKVTPLASIPTDDEMIKAYTLFQHETGTAVVVRGTRLNKEDMLPVQEAWSTCLREKVKASDAARKEAERLRVVCQGDWIDD